MSRSNFVYNQQSVEIAILDAIAAMKARDSLLGACPEADEGLLLSDLQGMALGFGQAACQHALKSLIDKGEIWRESGGRKKPYRITAQGEVRLVAYFSNLHKKSYRVSEKGEHTKESGQPAREDAPGTLEWLARMYAESMFPSDYGKKGRAK
jgi:hypothetical protein